MSKLLFTPRQKWLELGVLAAVAIITTVFGGVSFAAELPVTIGILGDQSGITSSTGGPGSVLAAQLAAADAGGQVLGRQIQIVSADHQNKADLAKTIALRWFGSENVSAIADLNFTPVALAVVEAGRSAKRITLISGATAANLTEEWCSPYSSMWADDTWTLSKGVVGALVKQGFDSWFFITNDNAFGKSLETLATSELERIGGHFSGSVKFPLGDADFSSYLLTAQQSSSKIVAIASAGSDTINALKQAAEFGITKAQKVVPLLTFITDIDAVGLNDAQGLTLLSGFYWDQSDEARRFSERFSEKMGRVPTKQQAAVYASVRHYLAAVKLAGTLDAQAVSDEMQKLPVDFLGRSGSVRRDGRVIFDVSLYQVKSPAESKARWDYYKEIARIPAAEAYHPLNAAVCKGSPS